MDPELQLAHGRASLVATEAGPRLDAQDVAAGGQRLQRNPCGMAVAAPRGPYLLAAAFFGCLEHRRSVVGEHARTDRDGVRCAHLVVVDLDEGRDFLAAGER